MRELITEIDARTMRACLFDSQKEAREAFRPAAKDKGWNQSWVGISEDKAFESIETGDLSLVPESDRMLEALEGKFDFPTSKYRTLDSVSGGVPNVPAMLANQPLNMRVRRRCVDDTAPLTICVDLTSSAAIKHEYLIKRGSAILALARILSGIRPVTIWLGAGLGGGRRTNGSTCWFQLDASPLDLARAAFQMSSASVPRGMMYAYLQEVQGSNGGWPLGDVDAWRRVAAQYLARWFDGEILFVPPVFAEDDFKVPEVWLERMVKQYGGRDQ